MVSAASEVSSASDFEKTAVRVSGVSIAGNLVLSVFKLFAGIFAHSGAMVSDAVHSASDVVSSLIVIVGVKLAARAPDREHPYGHERFECVAAIVLAVLLLVSGLFIGHTGIEKIMSGEAEAMEAPGVLALVAAAVSILVKEGMFWYTRHYARKYSSGALMADAWHHRSDALSSIGALIGIAGAMCGYPIADTVASLLICVFIAKAAYDIFRDAVGRMVDRACSAETEQAIRALAASVPGVVHVDLLQTRMFGSRIYVDIEISADGSLTLNEGHAIARKVHECVENRFPEVKHIMVHVNPDQEEDHE
ncbi:MAG: cation transporter [Clostridia bacterium]|nr:cation transporter [Clostridia bacterium]MBR0537061.1 cation transporter [Clostridia bacterium]